MDALAHFDTWQLIALAAALGIASGLRLYAVLFIVGAAGYLGFIDLPAGLAALAHPLVLAASGFMCFVEFFADKVPGVDSLWDVVHTLIRIPAGAALAAGVFRDSSSAMTLAAAILGGTLAAGSHFTKASSRAVINTSPEPFSNWAASLTEDVAVGGLLWLAIAHPLAGHWAGRRTKTSKWASHLPLRHLRRRAVVDRCVANARSLIATVDPATR